MKIRVEPVSGDQFRVVVDDQGPTSFTVTASSGYCAQLAGEQTDPERVVEASFRFLLDREPVSAILRTFELQVIARYFPEYESKLADYL